MTLPQKIGPGRLVLVVGPSGVGVDTMIDTARAALNGSDDYRFVKRTITRPADAGGEEHTPISVPAFEHAVEKGDFVLFWQAHGLHYGIPADIDADIAAGRTVVVNVSRTILETARARYGNLAIASITASRETLAKRLANRNPGDRGGDSAAPAARGNQCPIRPRRSYRGQRPPVGGQRRPVHGDPARGVSRLRFHPNHPI